MQLCAGLRVGCAGAGANRRAGLFPGSRSRALCTLPRSTLLPKRTFRSSELCVQAVKQQPGADTRHAVALASAQTQQPLRQLCSARPWLRCYAPQTHRSSCPGLALSHALQVGGLQAARRSPVGMSARIWRDQACMRAWARQKRMLTCTPGVMVEAGVKLQPHTPIHALADYYPWLSVAAVGGQDSKAGHPRA